MTVLLLSDSLQAYYVRMHATFLTVINLYLFSQLINLINHS